MTKYIVALDQGTSSCRAVLVDDQGQIVAIEQAEFTQYFPHNDWVEHDPEEIWEVQMKVFHDLIAKHVPNLQALVGIGITNQRETSVLWNKHTGKPVYNAIVWQDKRTSDLCKLLKEEGLSSYVAKHTGLTIDPYFSGTKLHWMLEHIDDDPEDLLFGTIDTWLIWKLTKGATHATDYTNASRTMLFDINKLDWDQTILARLGISAHLLPKVQQSASHYGTYEYQGQQIPIAGVAGDQQAALFGQACFDKGMAKNTYGTGCFMLMNIGKQFIASKNGLLTTLCCDNEGGVAYALEGSVFIAGAAVQWLRDGLKIIKDSADTEALALSIKDDHDVIVVPAFSGLGAPYWNVDSRGAIFGLTRSTGIEHFAKGTLDALAYRTKDVLDAMVKDSGVAIEILKVDGGAAKNVYLMQFQSDILQAEVEKPTNLESTALGAAYLAGMTLGLWDSSKVVENRKVEQTFRPQLALEKRDLLYAKWQRAISRTLDWKQTDTNA